MFSSDFGITQFHRLNSDYQLSGYFVTRILSIIFGKSIENMDNSCGKELEAKIKSAGGL
jgi:hypothetical protein